jgi:hypothetical protein
LTLQQTPLGLNARQQPQLLRMKSAEQANAKAARRRDFI